MNVNLQPVSNVIGALLVAFGALMLSCIGFSLYFQSGDAGALFKAGAITMIVGIVSWKYKFRNEAIVNKREGYLIVAFAWMAMVTFGTLPYYFSGVTENYTDALFESVSGLTTTGATIFDDIEFLPKGVLFWRSMTQWIGGMGVIVLTVAIFPLLGIGGIELFGAEAPGPTSDKIHPRIRETAKRLWLIYVGLTIAAFFIFMIQGMTGYDAINHAFTTIATGGFSTKNESIAFFDSAYIEYTIILFIALSATNYTLIYYGLKGKFRKVWSSDEFRFYIIFLILLAIIIPLAIYRVTDYSFEQCFREGLFQAVSIFTTTGYVTADYTSWSPGLTMTFFVLFFVGACAGSTSGSIKLIRYLVFIKNSLLEFKRLLHPRAIIRLKIDKAIVPPRILTHILVFLLLYLILFVSGSIVVTVLGMDFMSSMGAVAASLGNIGPAIGSVGPMEHFGHIPMAAKWVLSFLMILGRLELFTILILFSPYFWKVN